MVSSSVGRLTPGARQWLGWIALAGAGWVALARIAACSVQESQLLTAKSSSGVAGGAGAGVQVGGDTGGCPVRLVGWAAVNADGVPTTTGGGNATPQRVTSLEELRALAGDATPRVIELSGTITTGSDNVGIASNKMLVGVDRNATIEGGITMNGASNVIVRNLNIHGAGDGNTPVDAIGVRDSHHIWFDHLSVWDGPDGNLDITSGSTHVTVSWTRFWYSDPEHSHRQSCLVGASSSEVDVDTGKNNVTFHHNWFAELVDQRMPRLLFGQGHVFNSYYNSVGNSACISVGSFASGLIENNHFEDVDDPHLFADENPSQITAIGNHYSNVTGRLDRGQNGQGGQGGAAVEITPFTVPPYSYTLDDAEDVADIVTRCAGPQ